MNTKSLPETPLTAALPDAAATATAGTRAAAAGPLFDAHEAAVARRLEFLSSPPVAIPLIFVLGMLLFIVNLGGAPLYTKGEPREAVTVFDIVHGGGVILPLRAGVEIPSKPLLMHWLAAIVSIVAGSVNEWTVRLPSAVFAIGGMLATYLYVRRLFEARGALFSAMMLGTAFQYLQAGTGSRVDMTLTFFMTVAFFEFLAIAEGLSNRTTLFYFAIALAVLTKGPIGAALPVMVAIVWITFAWRWSILRRLHLSRGIVIVGLVGGGWYIAAIVSGGAAFVHKQILGENIYRLIGHAGVNHGHAHPFYYVEGALLAGFLPWTPIAMIAGLQALRRSRHLDPRLGYLCVWFLVTLIFYNLPQSKRGVYLLSLFPAMTTIVALYLSDAISHRGEIARPLKWLARTYGALFVATGAGAIAALALLYWYPVSIRWVLAQCGILLEQLPAALSASAYHRGLFSVVLPLSAVAVGIYLLHALPRVENIVFAITGGFVAIVLAVNLVVEPAVANTLTLKGFAATTMTIANGRPVGYWGSLDYDFAFYNGRNIQFVTKPDLQVDYVVTSEDDYKLMWSAMRARYETVLRSGPTDFNGTGRMILLRRIISLVPVPSSPSAVPKSTNPAPPVPPSAAAKSTT
jgi:4-amino-4-deoxy-L-arabinose transferase-like glycosyltransferase